MAAAAPSAGSVALVVTVEIQPDRVEVRKDSLYREVPDFMLHVARELRATTSNDNCVSRRRRCLEAMYPTSRGGPVAAALYYCT